MENKIHKFCAWKTTCASEAHIKKKLIKAELRTLSSMLLEGRESHALLFPGLWVTTKYFICSLVLIFAKSHVSCSPFCSCHHLITIGQCHRDQKVQIFSAFFVQEIVF